MPNFFKFNRFLPATKAWKIFAAILQRKLPKPSTSKHVKKPYKSRYGGASTKRISWPRLCVQTDKFKHKHKNNLHFHRKSPPLPAVYVDQLFLEPVSVIQEVSPVTASVVAKKKLPPSSTANMEDLLQDHGEEEGGVGVSGDQDSADHMWESLVFSSPQLNQINQRADEFIARFRQDMMLQERLARRL